MERKKGLMVVISALLLIILASGAYGIYHYSAVTGSPREEIQNDLTKRETDMNQAASEESRMPEEIQMTGSTVMALENLPVYEYEQREIEVRNQGQKIYGIAFIPQTGTETVPLVICAHGLGGSYQSNLAYAEQLASHGLAAYCFDFRGG